MMANSQIQNTVFFSFFEPLFRTFSPDADRGKESHKTPGGGGKLFQTLQSLFTTLKSLDSRLKKEKKDYFQRMDLIENRFLVQTF